MIENDALFKKSAYSYDLPEGLIAQHPAERRDLSRLMILNGAAEELKHGSFRDLLTELKQGDLLVVNNSKVIPARLIGHKEGLAHPAEVLLLKRMTENRWETIVKPGRRLRSGAKITFLPERLTGEVEDVLESGNRIVRFDYEGIWEEVLDEAGTMPLPPYIHEQLADPSRYNTVYAEHDGSAAAPTAGLHFTDELLTELSEQGIERAELTLHVGLGTFRPVKEDDIRKHPMHTEQYELSESAAERINLAKREGGRIIAVGTTACRVLESLGNEDGTVRAGSGETDIFIYPGYRFKVIDRLITNFHLPESTLLMLVSALTGREFMLQAYEEAVQRSYRFFSFGDAMLIQGRPESYVGLHEGRVYPASST